MPEKSRPPVDAKHQLLSIYRRLDAFFGDLKWWPGESPFEVVVGAILTQNTAWRNVEKAINKLKAGKLLFPEKLLTTEDELLADAIRSSGFYRIKTQRLKAFIRFLYETYNGNLEKMFAEEHWRLRRRLLQIKGIGPETADSILLYAGYKPIFVVDAYTRRILNRHSLIDEKASYTDIQTFFMKHLPGDVSLYNQFHALLVNTGKLFCKKNPRCRQCPLYAADIVNER
jgi:endonuclease-3 related protein